MHISGSTGFRTRQVLADLDRVAMRVVPDDPAGAAARLLTGVITGGSVSDADWDLARQGRGFRQRPNAVRAALMNAIEELRVLGQISGTCRPTADDLVTATPGDLEVALTGLVRSMTPAELDHVARADFGADADQHRTALAALLLDDRLAYPDLSGVPSRVVDLVANAPGQPGHVPCLALTLLHALRIADVRGTAARRLEAQFAEISRLHQDTREVLLAGFRHLYETNRQWSPKLPPAFTLPWTDPA
jgi:hypothetical protein